MGSTTDHLCSCCLIQQTEDLSMMRAEPAKVTANRGLMNWVLQLDRQRLKWKTDRFNSKANIQTIKLVFDNFKKRLHCEKNWNFLEQKKKKKASYQKFIFQIIRQISFHVITWVWHAMIGFNYLDVGTIGLKSDRNEIKIGLARWLESSSRSCLLLWTAVPIWSLKLGTIRGLVDRAVAWWPWHH